MAYIGKQPVIGNFQKCDSIAVVNGQAAYTLQVGGTNVSPQSENHMLVSLNGILQAPVDSFTVSGSTLTFASNLVTGDVIDFVMILGNVLDLGVPSDNTVSLAKLTATGTKDATTFLRGDNTFASAGGDNTPTWHGKLGSDSSNQTAGAYVKVTGMTTDEVDTNTAFDGTTFTVPSGEAGKYFVFGTVTMSTVGGSYTGEATEGLIYVNGSSVIKSRFRNHSNRDIGEDSQQVMGILDLSVGDTVELYGRLASDDFKFTASSSSFGGTNFGGYKLIGV